MTPLQTLHYALGKLAYAIAFNDGKIQERMCEEFKDFIEIESFSNKNLIISDTIFRLMKEDNIVDTETSYLKAMEQIRQNGYYLSPKLKEIFTKVIEKMTRMYQSPRTQENCIFERFKKDIAGINSDPDFYGKA